MTTLYQITNAKREGKVARMRMVLSGWARRAVLALETGAVMAFAGLFVAAIRSLHVWYAIAGRFRRER
jgi:hypothetical protein